MMKHFAILISFTVLMMSATFALADTDDDLLKLDRFLKQNPIGTEDVYLQMNTTYGWTTVAIVVGYWDDWVACNELKQGLKLTGNPRDYRCVPAN